MLIKLYSFLSRRTDSKFNNAVHKRLNQSNVNRYPMSVSKLVQLTKSQDLEKSTIVFVGKVLNDERLLEFPKMNVCALAFTEDARDRIVKAGGKCMTFDQLARLSPKRENTLLLRGNKKREALKHFGAGAGIKGSHTKPYVLNGNHKKERKYCHLKKK